MKCDNFFFWKIHYAASTLIPPLPKSHSLWDVYSKKKVMNHHRSKGFLEGMMVIAHAHQDSGYRQDTLITTRTKIRRRWRPLWPAHTALLEEMGADCARFDLGPVYTFPYEYATGVPASSYNSIEGRELVFDVDAKDYGVERATLSGCGCGIEKKICLRCWGDILLPQARILEEVMKRDLSCRCSQVFFSGRGGWHLWCADAHLYAMDAGARRRVVAHVKKVIPGLHLDGAVTEQLGHLIRAPLSSHQDTGFLVSPLDMRDPKGGNFPAIPALNSRGVELAEYHASRTLPQLFRASYPAPPPPPIDCINDP